MKIKKNSGQSLFEVVVAIGISALVVTGIVAAASNSIQNSSYSKDKNVATNYVQETMEWLRQERDKNLANFKLKITGSVGMVYCLPALSAWPAPTSKCSDSQVIPNTKFVRKLEFPEYATDVVRAKATVTWKDAKGTHEVSSSTDLSLK